MGQVSSHATRTPAEAAAVDALLAGFPLPAARRQHVIDRIIGRTGAPPSPT
jgi:hypothetical protein